MVKLNPSGFPSQDVGGAYSQGNWAEYEWIVVVGGLAAFFMAWGIGANDVANSFATSVGSKTLKMWQALIIAGIMEFVGAMVLGGEVAKTVATDIARVEYFNNFPEVYMYGMLCSLTVAGTWLLIATYGSLAVSTTHSIIGSILGFALVYGGKNAVKWDDCKVEFPFLSGFVPVVLSWFVAPIVAGILSSIIFFLNRVLVLRRQNSTQKAMWGLPILIFLCVFINLLFVLGKGAKQDMQKRWPPVTRYSRRCDKNANGGRGTTYSDFTDLYNAAAWISAAVGGGLAVIGGAIGIPLMKRRYNADMERERNGGNVEEPAAVKAGEGSDSEPDYDNINLEKPAHFYMMPVYYCKLVYMTIRNWVLKGLFYDVHCDVAQNVVVSSIHEAAEVFDPHTEQVYKVLQVFSSCCVAFAHGANDVANAIGPFSGIYAVYKTWQVPSSNAEADKWIFVLGGVGIVIGLMTYGYNIIKELGVSLLKLTPSRGFSAELATGLTISLASFYGLPISTTQTIVGAETGVGLVENVKTGINWPIFGKTFLGWIWTIIISALLTGCLFAMGVYAPSVHMANDIMTYRYGMGNATLDMYNALNRANLQYNRSVVPGEAPEAWWTLAQPRFSGFQANGSSLNSTLASVRSNVDIVSSHRKSRTRHYYVDPEFAVYWLRRMNTIYRNYSVITVGQNATLLTRSDAWAQPPSAASGH